jgi:hypothetical protein
VAGNLRNPGDPVRAEVAEAVVAAKMLSVKLLYSDQVGRQRTILLQPDSRQRHMDRVAGATVVSGLGRPEARRSFHGAAEAVLRDGQAADER